MLLRDEELKDNLRRYSLLNLNNGIDIIRQKTGNKSTRAFDHDDILAAYQNLNVFPDIMKNAALILQWSYLEATLQKVSEFSEEYLGESKLKIFLKQNHLPRYQRYIEYLRNVFNIENQYKAAIIEFSLKCANYSKIRNALVHNGKIILDDKLKQWIRSKDYIRLNDSNEFEITYIEFNNELHGYQKSLMENIFTGIQSSLIEPI